MHMFHGLYISRGPHNLSLAFYSTAKKILKYK